MRWLEHRGTLLLGKVPNLMHKVSVEVKDIWKEAPLCEGQTESAMGLNRRSSRMLGTGQDSGRQGSRVLASRTP